MSEYSGLYRNLLNANLYYSELDNDAVYMLKPAHVTLPLALLSPLELLQCEQILLLETQLSRKQNIAKNACAALPKGSISIGGQ